MTVCRACGAEVRWAMTTRGKRIPLDADPDPAGNVLLMHGVTAMVVGSDPTLDPADDGTRYMPHHATCPTWPSEKRGRGG